MRRSWDDVCEVKKPRNHAQGPVEDRQRGLPRRGVVETGPEAGHKGRTGHELAVLSGK